MKLLTLNTHSLVEDGYEKKLKLFCEAIALLKPDIIALQEVNQPRLGEVIKSCEGYPLRRGNHLERVGEELNAHGLSYHSLWYGFKKSYCKFEEGLGIMSKEPFLEKRIVRLSGERKDWKLRYTMGVRVGDVWYYSVHTGRPGDCDEPFMEQIDRLMDEIKGKRAVIMGDFNCPDTCPEYAEIIRRGLYDAYDNAKERRGYHTAESKIDGWGEGCDRMRIDYILTNFNAEFSMWQTVFTPEDFGVVSDHFGVLAQWSL